MLLVMVWLEVARDSNSQSEEVLLDLFDVNVNVNVKSVGGGRPLP